MATFRIETPDGAVYDVDGVADEQEAWRAVQSQQGNPAPPAVPSAQGQAPARKASIPQAAAAGFANSLLVGAAPQVAARNEAIGGGIGRGDLVGAGQKAMGYFTAPGRAIYQALGLTDLARDRSDDPAMAGRRKEFRQAFADAARDRPVSTIAGGLAGAAMPIVGGASRARDFGGRVLEGAKAGGMFGGAYGWNSAEDGQQPEQAVNGAIIGAGLGAATPVATAGAGMFGSAVKNSALRSDTVRGALNAIDDELYRRPFSPGTVNASIGPAIPPRSRPGRATPRFRPPANYVERRAAQLADRAGLDAGELDTRIATAQADPRGLIMAELYGQPGVDAAATLSRMPGQTGQLARTQLGDRNMGTGQRLLDDLSGQPGEDAVGVLSERVRSAAAQYLRPAFERPVTPQQQAASVEALQRLSQRESIADALPMAQRDINELIQLGDLPPSAAQDPAYLLHYAKMALARMAKDPTTVAAGKPRLDNMFLTRAQKDIADTLERIRPGYAQAMAELQRAIRPREVAQDIVNMRGKQPNVAGRLLGDPEVRRQLGRPGLENFGPALRKENEMFGDASRIMPGTNSITSTAIFGAGDEMAMGMSNVPTTKEGMIGAALNYFRQGVNETKRNEFGRFLLRVVDDPDSGLSAQERQDIAAELARIHRERATQTAATRAAARAGGMQANTMQGQ
jgi:hypothetical protein